MVAWLKEVRTMLAYGQAELVEGRLGQEVSALHMY